MSDRGYEGNELRAHIERLDRELAELRNRLGVLEGTQPSLNLPPVIDPPSDRQELESRLGLTAANRIGAFTLALGIIFFFKYAVDNEWIGAIGRVITGASIGLFLIAAAEWLNRRGQRTFSQGVSGCGVAALYISLYAAFALYQLISRPEAFLALVGTCSLAVALSWRYVNSAIAGLGFGGGLLTPLLLDAGTSMPSPDALYVALLDVTCILIAVRQRWATLVAGIGAATLAVGWVLLGSRHPDGFALFAVALAGVHAVAAYRHWDAQTLRNVLYPMANAYLIVAVLRELELWTSRNIALANRASVTSELSSVFLAIYGICVLIHGIARASEINRTLALFLLAFVIAKLYVWDVWFLERFYRTTAFVGLGVLLLAASWIFSRSKPRAGS